MLGEHGLLKHLLRDDNRHPTQNVGPKKPHEIRKKIYEKKQTAHVTAEVQHQHRFTHWEGTLPLTMKYQLYMGLVNRGTNASGQVNIQALFKPEPFLTWEYVC